MFKKIHVKCTCTCASIMKIFLMKEVRDGKSKETRWNKYNNSKLQQ